MEDPVLRPSPGKTAPRLLGDLFEYDCRRPPPSGANLLVDPAPIYRENKKDSYPLRQRPQDCTHRLWRKEQQSVVPGANDTPSTTSIFISSSYCDRCFYHFDVIADYTRRPGGSTPCHKDNKSFPLHHLQHSSSTRKSAAERRQNPNKYDNPQEVHSFFCSAPDCPLVVEIRLSPPRLSKDRLILLVDKAKLYQRGLRAMQANPDRFKASRPNEPWEALNTLRQYLSDAMNSAGEGKKIAVQNKRFLLVFGDECNELFRYLEFTPYSEENAATNSIDSFWKLPAVEPLDDDAPACTKSQADFLMDVNMELSHRIVENLGPSPPPNFQVAFSPFPAFKDLNKILGCLDYPREKRPIELDEAPHPHYLGLGAAADFSDPLLLFAFERQRECDPKNKPYYLECLWGISRGRQSADLDEEYAKAVSMGEHRLSEIEDAYKFLGISPDNVNGDDWIIGMYHSRVESAPRQKDEARQCLLVIGQARDSEKIQAVANDRVMTYKEAMELLGLAMDTPSDFVEAVATSMIADGNKAQIARAVRTVGQERREPALELFAQGLESGDSTGISDVAEAYRRLQVNDRSAPDQTIITYYQSLTANAPPGSKASYLQALRTIANSRNSSLLKAQADNPDGPMPVEKGSEDQPVGLDNIGNTCYLNSLLQYYYTVKAVRDVVMNFPEYRMELNTENMLKKRVGGRAVARGEIVKAQKFVEELQSLFRNLKEAPTRSVKPTEDLAVLTLFSTATEANFRRASINSPGAMPSISSLMDRPVFGPELPPPPPPPTRPTPQPPAVTSNDVEMVDRPAQEAVDQDDGSSDTTLVDLDPQAPDSAPLSQSVVMTDIKSEGKEPGEPTVDTNVLEPEYLIVSTDKTNDKDKTPGIDTTAAVQTDVQHKDQTMTNGELVASPIVIDSPSFETPPPVPPRNKPSPISISSPSDDSMRAEKLSFGAQQDVTEVIGNVMFRLQCAIKPTSIDPKFGEQIDKIRETFFGANAVHLKKGSDYSVKVEDWANLIVFPSEEGARDIYEALDVVFDEQVVEINNSLTKQFAAISKLPPIFQVQIQRTAFDPKTQQASKNQNAIVFDETIYIDRFMEDDRVLSRRREAWRWKTKLRKLESRQKALRSTITDISVPEALNATKDFLRMLQEEEVDGVLIDGPMTESLSDRAAELESELKTIDSEIAGLKQKLQDQFTDMREHRYRLQAVFMHRGSSAFGHYWIYIYDFERDIWREYNDDRVSEVTDRKKIFEQSVKNGPTPYYLVYVRDEQKDELVDAVYRKIVEVPEETPEMDVRPQMETNWQLEREQEMVQKGEVTMGAEHVEYASLGGTMDQDVSGVGAWDHTHIPEDAEHKW